MVKIVFYLPDSEASICSLYSVIYIVVTRSPLHYTHHFLMFNQNLQSLHISYLLYFCFPFSFPFSSLFALLGQ